MNTKTPLVLIVIAVLLSGCTDRSKEAEKAKEEAAAKAHADAAKKEMQTLPQAFSTPDYYKKNERPESSSSAAKSEPTKK